MEKDYNGRLMLDLGGKLNFRSCHGIHLAASTQLLHSVEISERIYH